MSIAILLALMAVVFLIVGGLVLALFIGVFRRIRSGDLVARSPQSDWRHDPSHTATSDRMGNSSDYT